MRIDILSLFPGYFRGPLDESILRRAQERGLLDIHLTDIRDFSKGASKRVDDRPYGGGPGMVMMPGPSLSALRNVKTEKSHVVYLSPQGTPFNAAKARELSQNEHLVFLCGHYEGVDQRVLDLEVDEEVSIGDYVLTNGCLSALVLIDALARFVPGVLGHESAAAEDSFENGILDWPHYTRPPSFEGLDVPEVLQSGNHAAIAKWRLERALEKTNQVRPDLYARRCEGKNKL